jgi:FkbM family methyltransferase
MGMIKDSWNLFNYVWNHPLNAGSKLAGLLRIVRWQIASRLIQGPIALPFVEDTYLFAKCGMTGATGNWYCGLDEWREMSFVLHLLRSEDHFIDVGANIGSYTILAGGAVGARVTAVEPIPETIDALEKNVRLNNLVDHVRICQVGLSDRESVLRFSIELDSLNHVLTKEENLQCIDVPVVRMDKLLGDDIPLLMKIDVEGHELAVLLGAENIMGNQHLLAVIMETNSSGERYGITDSALIDIMKQYGFYETGYDPFTRSLTHPVCHENTIFIRDRTEVQRRLKSSRRYNLVNGSI